MHTHIHAHTQAHRILNCVMHLCILVCAELGVGQSSGMGVAGGGSQRRGHLGMRTSVYRERERGTFLVRTHTQKHSPAHDVCCKNQLSCMCMPACAELGAGMQSSGFGAPGGSAYSLDSLGMRKFKVVIRYPCSL